MPSVTINEKDYTIWNVTADNDNIVYVPGFTITGPYEEPTMLSSYADLIRTYGDMPPAEQYASGATNATYKMCTSWEYAAEVLNGGFPVLFQRIVPYKRDTQTGELVIDTDKIVSAGEEFSNTYATYNPDTHAIGEDTFAFKFQEKYAGTYGNRLKVSLVINNARDSLYLKIWDTYNGSVLEYIKVCAAHFTNATSNLVDHEYLLSFAKGFTAAIDSSDYLEFVSSTEYADSIAQFNEYIKQEIIGENTDVTITFTEKEDGTLVYLGTKEVVTTTDVYTGLPNDATFDGEETYYTVAEETVTAETFDSKKDTLLLPDSDTYKSLADDATFDATATYYKATVAEVTSETFDELKASLYTKSETSTSTTEDVPFNSLTFANNVIDTLFVNKNTQGTTGILERCSYILGKDNFTSVDEKTTIVATVGKDFTYNEAITDPVSLCDTLERNLTIISDNILFDVKFITKGAIALDGGDNTIVGNLRNSQGKTYNSIVADFCALRGDCVSMLEPGYMYGQLAVPEDFMEIYGTPATYVAAYAPWCVMAIFNGYARWCPPSLVFLTALERSVVEEGNPVYLPPAGVNRASIPEIIDSEYKIGSAILNKWQDKNELRNINPIMQLNNYGYVIFGQRTLYDVSDSITTYRSALQEFGVRLMVIECKKRIRQVATGLLFEYNNIHTWNEFKAGVMPLFETMVANGAIQRYQIIMDESVISPDDIDDNKIRGIIKVVPGRAVEDFIISFELYRSDVTFDDEEIANAREDIYQS